MKSLNLNMIRLPSSLTTIKRPICFCFILFSISFTISFFTIKYKNTKLRMDQNESDFYIHLKSDVRLTSPLMVGNKIGNFITRLNRKYNLTDEYKVALSRLHYTKSWYNIEGNHYLWMTDGDRDTFVIPEDFPAGNYITVGEILDLLNQIYARYANLLSDEVESPPVFEYNKFSNTIRVKLGIKKNKIGPGRFIYPVTTEYLARFLGLADRNGEQYPFSDGQGIIFKKVKKSQEPVQVSMNQSYHQQVNKLSVEMNDFKQALSDLLKKRTEQTTEQIDASFENQQKIKPAQSLTIDKTETPITQAPNANAHQNVTPAQRTADPAANTSTTAQNTSTPTQNTNDPAANTASSTQITATPTQKPSKFTKITVSKKKKPKMHDDDVSMQGDDPNTDDTEEVAYIYAFKQVSLHGYINNLNIYCNLIKPVSVGDVEVPLLRSVAVNPNDEFGKYVEYEPNIREYYPLLYHEFENIEIDIKSDDDETIDFRFGQVYLSLHFRKSNINTLT